MIRKRLKVLAGIFRLLYINPPEGQKKCKWDSLFKIIQSLCGREVVEERLQFHDPSLRSRRRNSILFFQ